ncbi:hypothetical protein VV01_03155 [Luteipulveratus halotolerans]|uniref:Glycosyltransferase RgtA/B/C/D-like domain-containing protein n=1 Tax=Luteipulveratus halotolerans TaxID=1631356 RepID=A0A0L6CEX3_9MICO|nr:hypothetical protein VV01_03155 [Luteipulveratus halotolerans]
MQVVVGTTLVVVAAGALISPRMPWRSYDRGVVTLLTPVLVALALLVCWGVQRRPRAPSRRRELAVAAATTCLCTAVCGGFAIALTYRLSWDPLTVARASGYADPPPYLQAYFAQYPNNVPLLAIAQEVRRVAGALGTSYATTFILLNCVALAATLASVYAVGRVLRSHRAGMAALLGTAALVGLSPWLIAPYSDLLVVPCPIGGLALVLLAARAGRRSTAVVLTAAAMLLLTFGTLLKPTAAVMTVALAAVAVPAMLARTRRHRAVTTAVVAVVCGLALTGLSTAAHAASESASDLDGHGVHEVHAATPLTFLAGGLLTQHPWDGHERYGGYDRGWVQRLKGLDAAEMNDLSWELIDQTVQRRGITGMASFEWAKARWNWGDGMFFAWGEEMDPYGSLTAHTRLTPFVRSWNHPTGDLFAARTDLTTASWLALLLVTGGGLLVAPYRRPTLTMALAVLGIGLFTLLFQGRSRYLLPYVPVVVTLGALMLPELHARLRQLPSGLGRTRKATT